MAKAYAFGPFRLDVEGDVLFRGAEPVALGRRAVVLLRVLVERPGTLVTKDALIEAGWSGLAVEESNLSVQFAALRRALSVETGAERWIETLALSSHGNAEMQVLARSAPLCAPVGTPHAT